MPLIRSTVFISVGDLDPHDPRVKTEDMCLRVSYKKKNVNIFFSSLKSLKKGVGSGSISQRSGSALKCHGSPTLVFNLSRWTSQSI
jgi:hypothetical protein